MSRLAYIAFGACAATIIVLVAMSRKEPATAYEEPEDDWATDPYTFELSDGTQVSYTGAAYPAGLVRHG